MVCSDSVWFWRSLRYGVCVCLLVSALRFVLYTVQCTYEIGGVRLECQDKTIATCHPSGFTVMKSGRSAMQRTRTRQPPGAVNSAMATIGHLLTGAQSG